MSIRIIAEAGVNHNGDVDRAVALVDAAAGVGADAVKFQTFRAEALATSSAPKAVYQRERTAAAESQQTMLRALELSEDAHRRLKSHAEARGLEFLSTPFDLESLAFLASDLQVGTIKLGSGEVTNGPLLVAAGRSGKAIILSTGMSTLEEVADALSALVFGMMNATRLPTREVLGRVLVDGAVPEPLRDRITLLHCTTAYPAPAAEANLRAMASMAETFGVPVGLSDHSEGIVVPIAAAACGAAVIEKHLTLDRTLPGPDHAASAEPKEFTAMVRAIRLVEAALGDGVKRPQRAEIDNIPIARKSLVAARPVARGDVLDEATIAVKRPGTGVSPMDYWAWLGRAATRDFAADEELAP